MAIPFIVGVFVIAIGVVVIALGTMTNRALKNPSYPPGTPTRAGSGFPSDYSTAREVFLDAVAKAGGRLESIEHPEESGPDDEPLFMDVASFGDEAAKRTLVICSGTHGVEGFAGSGIQTRLLREGIASSLAPTVNLLMIHAVNPYGMAHLRRFNEENVDVNRNFRDFSTSASMNVAYEDLSETIAPHAMSFWAEVAAWRRMFAYRATRGKARLQAAVTRGQYDFPEGLFYGGTYETWSNHTVKSVIARYLTGQNQVIVVDLHTGLGAYASGEILLREDASEYQRAVQIWGADLVKRSAAEDSVSVRIEAIMNRAFSDVLGKNIETTAVTLEFGTLPPMEVFIALRAENWLHHHGQNDPRAKQIKASLLSVFHPGLQEWEEAVWVQGSNVAAQALTYLAQSSPK